MLPRSSLRFFCLPSRSTPIPSPTISLYFIHSASCLLLPALVRKVQTGQKAMFRPQVLGPQNRAEERHVGTITVVQRPSARWRIGMPPPPQGTCHFGPHAIQRSHLQWLSTMPTLLHTTRLRKVRDGISKRCQDLSRATKAKWIPPVCPPNLGPAHFWWGRACEDPGSHSENIASMRSCFSQSRPLNQNQSKLDPPVLQHHQPYFNTKFWSEGLQVKSQLGPPQPTLICIHLVGTLQSQWNAAWWGHIEGVKLASS